MHNAGGELRLLGILGRLVDYQILLRLEIAGRWLDISIVLQQYSSRKDDSRQKSAVKEAHVTLHG
jgi:hypothetical protein